jgi:hypothetical protein
VPLDDPRQVRSLEDAFDLTTPEIRLWELHLIWRAVDEGLVRFDDHGDQARIDESVVRSDVLRIIIGGTPRSKDLDRSAQRHPGINFEGKASGCRTIRAKVSWFLGYVVVTVHTL